MFWADSWLFLRRNSFDRFYGFVWLRRFSYPRRSFKKLVQVLILIGIVFRHLFVDKPQIELPLSGMLNYRKRFAVRDFGQFNPLLGLLGLGRLLFIMHLIIISVYLVDWEICEKSSGKGLAEKPAVQSTILPLYQIQFRQTGLCPPILLLLLLHLFLTSFSRHFHFHHRFFFLQTSPVLPLLPL